MAASEHGEAESSEAEKEIFAKTNDASAKTTTKGRVVHTVLDSFENAAQRPWSFLDAEP